MLQVFTGGALIFCRSFNNSKDRISEYKIIEADNSSFDEVLISKRMVQDHMPDTVLKALEEVSVPHHCSADDRCNLQCI